MTDKLEEQPKLSEPIDVHKAIEHITVNMQAIHVLLIQLGRIVGVEIESTPLGDDKINLRWVPRNKIILPRRPS